jgi:hypothetical protein
MPHFGRSLKLNHLSDGRVDSDCLFFDRQKFLLLSSNVGLIAEDHGVGLLLFGNFFEGLDPLDKVGVSCRI